MRSLQRRFNTIQQQNPYWSSYICFAEAVTNQQFSRSVITYWFGKLVEKDDYARSDYRALIKNLLELNNSAEERLI